MREVVGREGAQIPGDDEDGVRDAGEVQLGDHLEEARGGETARRQADEHAEANAQVGARTQARALSWRVILHSLPLHASDGPGAGPVTGRALASIDAGNGGLEAEACDVAASCRIRHSSRRRRDVTAPPTPGP